LTPYSAYSRARRTTDDSYNFYNILKSVFQAVGMPSATVESHGIATVAAFGSFLDDLLAQASAVKTTSSVDPPLNKSDFEDLQGRLNEVLSSKQSPSESNADAKRTQRFAIIETAVRDTFGNLIVGPPPTRLAVQIGSYY
jgi:hypothetical protein